MSVKEKYNRFFAKSEVTKSRTAGFKENKCIRQVSTPANSFR